MKLLRLLNSVIEKICAVLIIEITILTFFQVVSRYCFGVAFFWAEEIVLFSMIWLVFLGVTIGIIRQAHTRIDYFIKLLPEKAYRTLLCFGHAVCILFVAWSSWHSIGIVKFAMQNLSPGAKIPMGLVYGSFPVCGIVMIIYLIGLIYCEISGKDILENKGVRP